MTPPKASPILFELPIPSGDAELGVKGNGNITCTQPSPKTYLLTFAHGPDNRLITSFCKTLMLALDILQHRFPPGVVITTSSNPKFYSNGMDITHAQFSRDYMPAQLYGLWKKLLTFPMPTIALCNGHAFAGGFMLAMMHDYRVMNAHRGFLCLNELELGMPLRPAMMAVFRAKVKDGNVLRKMVLEAHRFKALEALSDGVVDHVGGLEETLAFVEELKLVQKAQPGAAGVSVYGELKREMWRETVGMFDDWVYDSVRPGLMRAEVKKEEQVGLKKVEEWEKTRAKL